VFKLKVVDTTATIKLRYIEWIGMACLPRDIHILSSVPEDDFIPVLLALGYRYEFADVLMMMQQPSTAGLSTRDRYK
jgi:hypothetical protein